MWTKNTDIRIAKWGGTCFDDIVTSGIYGLTLNDLNSETRGDYGASISQILITYFCDAMWTEKSGIMSLGLGGSVFDDLVVSGIFANAVNMPAVDAATRYGASISLLSNIFL